MSAPAPGPEASRSGDFDACMTAPPHFSISERRSIAWMLLSIVLYAANVLILRAASQASPLADAWVATAFRGSIGLVLVAALFGGRGFQASSLIHRPLVLARGIVGAGAILLFYFTIPHLGAGRAVILNLTYPVFAGIMARFWIGESLSRRQLGWMLLSLAGLALFLGGDAWKPGALRWELIGLLGAVAAGGAVVLIRELRHTEHPSTVFASQCLWSLVLTVPFSIGPLQSLPHDVAAALIAAAVLVGLAQLAMTHAFRSLSVARGSAIQMLLPLLTTAGGMALFGERLSGVELVGAALTLWGTYEAVRPKSQ